MRSIDWISAPNSGSRAARRATAKGFGHPASGITTGRSTSSATSTGTRRSISRRRIRTVRGFGRPVLFDDDGKVYVVWGYQDLHFAQLDTALTDIVPGTERVLFAKDAGMGEGAHF